MPDDEARSLGAQMTGPFHDVSSSIVDCILAGVEWLR
jgi:hypothetical protein